MANNDDDEKYPEINFQVADLEKQCAVCHVRFTERENTGRWECSEHAGEIVNGRFTCCNTATIYTTLREFYKNNTDWMINGCVPCDHKAHLIAFSGSNGKAKVPRRYVPSLKANPRAWELRENSRKETQFYVYRFDKARREKLLRRMNMHFLAAGNAAPAKHLLKRSLINAS